MDSTMATTMLSCITASVPRDADVSTVILSTDALKFAATEVKMLRKLVLPVVFKAAIRSVEKDAIRLVA